MLGKLYLTSVNKKDLIRTEEKLFIVRSCKNPQIFRNEGWKIVSELSPYSDLFKTYLELKEMNNWNKETFETIYKPTFISQLNNDKDAQNALYKIKDILDYGIDITLMCYCIDESLCHRSIIGDKFRNLNYEVISI